MQAYSWKPGSLVILISMAAVLLLNLCGVVACLGPGLVSAPTLAPIATRRSNAMPEGSAGPPGNPTLPPSWTPKPTASLTPTRTPSATFTPTATSSITPSLTPRPSQASVVGLIGHKQTKPLSCEARSAVDWAAYFGLAIDEIEFLQRLPVSDNPETGFVGEPEGEWGQMPPAAYGVHAEPVAALLRAYGVNAQAQRGLTWSDLQAEILAGRPVIVWVTGHVSPGTPENYTAADGQTVTVARFEHTVMVSGYTEKYVIILDGASTYPRSIDTFLNSWSVLGNMGIVWRSNP